MRKFSPIPKLILISCTLLGVINKQISTVNKQLLDEVFVISRIIKVSVRVISLSRYTLNETRNSYLCFFTDGKQTKASNLDMINP